MTTATDTHPFVAKVDAIDVCEECGEGPNTDAHSEQAAQNGAEAPKRGRPRKAVETEERAQMALEERDLNDPALEGHVREWVSAKGGIDAAREDFKNVDKVLTGLIGDREMQAGTYRVGAYVVTISHVAAHQRLKIKLAKT